MLRALRLTGRRAGLALLYHGISARQGNPARELVPPLRLERFRHQLRHLRRHYEIVPCERFVEAINQRRRGQRFPVCLTFDDDLPEHASHALPALRTAKAPATFFLCGSFLDHPPTAFWWQRMQRAFDRGATAAAVADLLPDRVRAALPQSPDIHGLADAMIELEPAERDAVNAALTALAGADTPDQTLSNEDAARLVGDGCTIGFHTRRHDVLTTIGDARLERALSDSLEELAALAGNPIRSIAYPYGIVDARVAAAARRAGFELGFTCRSVAATPGSDPLLTGRLEPGAMSLGAFALAMVRPLLTPGRR
jgi:peptidoglycan/xylan/chitin deacetylase (PgdA/CDA1 family)